MNNGDQSEENWETKESADEVKKRRRAKFLKVSKVEWQAVAQVFRKRMKSSGWAENKISYNQFSFFLHVTRASNIP